MLTWNLRLNRKGKCFWIIVTNLFARSKSNLRRRWRVNSPCKLLNGRKNVPLDYFLRKLSAEHDLRTFHRQLAQRCTSIIYLIWSKPRTMRVICSLWQRRNLLKRLSITWVILAWEPSRRNSIIIEPNLLTFSAPVAKVSTTNLSVKLILALKAVKIRNMSVSSRRSRPSCSRLQRLSMKRWIWLEDQSPCISRFRIMIMTFWATSSLKCIRLIPCITRLRKTAIWMWFIKILGYRRAKFTRLVASAFRAMMTLLA